MAKALTRQPGRRSKTPDPLERELKRLRLSVCDDVGFRLYLATYDQPKRRDELIERIVQEAETANVRVTRLDLAQTGPESNLVGLLRAHLERTDLPPGWRQAVMIAGVEQRLDYSAGPKGLAFLHQANLLRDALPEAAPVPVVLWLSRLASAALPAEAPDLWHWRAANFDFTGDLAPRVELLRELTSLRPEEERQLSGEQRRTRLRMLEDMRAELERESPPKSKRQASERASLLFELGIQSWQLGLADEAIPRLERALDLYRGAGDRVGAARAAHTLGLFYGADDPRRAIDHYERGRAMAREVGDRRLEVDALGSLGRAYAALDESQRAIEHYEQAHAIAREIGDRRREGQALANLAKVYADLGEPRRAIKLHEETSAIAREIGDRKGECAALGSQGTAYAALGEWQRAIEHYGRALSIARDIGDRHGECWMLGCLGMAHAALGEPQRAIEHYEQELAIGRHIADRREEGFALSRLGLTYLALGEPRRAIEYLEQNLAIAREIGERPAMGLALFSSALAFDQLGERREAIKRIEEALRMFEQIGSKRLAEKARTQLAEWQGRSG